MIRYKRKIWSLLPEPSGSEASCVKVGKSSAFSTFASCAEGAKDN